MPGHSRAEDRPPDCCGQRRRKGRPGRADSFALMLHGDYIRIPGRPTVGGGAPCSGCSLGMSHKGRECSGCSPYVLGGKGGQMGRKTQKYYALKPSRSLGALRAGTGWSIHGKDRWNLPCLCVPLSGFLGSLSWPCFSVGDQTHLK